MRCWLQLLAFVTGISLATLTVPAEAQSITIKNARDEKVKLCTYRSDDKSLIRPRKCWMLRKGGKVLWNRGRSAGRFDVRLFEPGAFELPICLRRNIGDIYLLEIVPKNTGNCVVGSSRTAIPPQKWQRGDRVLVNRNDDDFWYPATILGPQGSMYRVRFATGRVGSEDARYIGDDIITAGSRIECSWKNFGRWLPGRVKSRDGDHVVIDYDDGLSERAALSYVRVAILQQ